VISDGSISLTQERNSKIKILGTGYSTPELRTVPILRNQELSSLSPEFPGIPQDPSLRQLIAGKKLQKAKSR